MESEIEDLQNSIYEILGYIAYMCSHCGKTSNKLLKEASVIDKNTVVKVNNGVTKLLNGMTANLTDCVNRFNKAMERYNREANQAAPEPISQAKKKVNLRLNGDKDTVLEDPSLFSSKEDSNNLEVLSAETGEIFESLSTKSCSDSFDNPNTGSDASMSDGESDHSSSILNTRKTVCRLPMSSEDSVKEETPCTKNIRNGVRRDDELSNQEIDRLCDLNSLNKRNCESVLERTSKDFKRIRLTNSSSESLNLSFDPDKQIQMFTSYILDNLGNESQSDVKIEDATKTSTETSKSADSTSEEAGKDWDTLISKTNRQVSLTSAATSEFDRIRALPNNTFFDQIYNRLRQ